MIANINGNIRGVCHRVSWKYLKRYPTQFSWPVQSTFLGTSQLFKRNLHACLSTTKVTFAELKAWSAPVFTCLFSYWETSPNLGISCFGLLCGGSCSRTINHCWVIFLPKWISALHKT